MSLLSDTITPPTVKRTLLYQASGRDAITLVEAELKRLEELHLKTLKKRLEPSILSISHWGEAPNGKLGLTAYTTEAQADALAFLRAQVTVSPFTTSQSRS